MYISSLNKLLNVVNVKVKMVVWMKCMYVLHVMNINQSQKKSINQTRENKFGLGNIPLELCETFLRKSGL